MQTQRHLFQLPENLHYINGAYMSPLMKAAEEAGLQGLARKRNPANFTPNDFFDDVERVKEKFGRLIHASGEQVAVIPSASYGLMNAVQNVQAKPGQHAITVLEEFPSGHFALSRWCDDNNAELKIIRPDSPLNKYERWNEKIIQSINQDTAMVLMSAIHWMDGTLFKLKEIGARCAAVGAAFIVDGSQSVGALPIDVIDCKIDALICAAYKWLLGPYSLGFGYYGERFNSGKPIEESWMNRNNAKNFSQLTDYDFSYGPGAQRYCVGETTNLIHMPIAETGLDHLLQWTPDSIQEYCARLTAPLIDSLRSMDIQIEADHQRAFHLFGIRLPEHVDGNKLLNELKRRNIILSIRGNSIRVSPNVYNTAEDISALQLTLEEFINAR